MASKDRKEEIVCARRSSRCRSLLQRRHTLHPVAGVGTTFVKDGEGDEQRYLPRVEGTRACCCMRSADPLPEGFFKAIHATNVGKAQVDYLPTVPNLPTTKPVGRVKPRSAAEDWLAIGFDPWSAGKEPLSHEFIPAHRRRTTRCSTTSRRRTTTRSSTSWTGRASPSRPRRRAAGQARCPDCGSSPAPARHGKYREIEDAMNQPDWTLPIDYQDELGNTLLQIAVQNGNKRITKLCLRRGAEINKQNLGGPDRDASSR